jgi:hypothetical protein
MRALAVLLLTIALSGCLLGGDSADFDGTQREIELEAAAFLLPTFETNQSIMRGVEFVGYSNGISTGGSVSEIPAGGYFTELAITDNYAYIARGSQNGNLDEDGSFGGFSIINIRDKTSPTFVGSFEAPTGGDIAINDDETLAFFTTQRNDVAELTNRLQGTQSLTSTLPRGIYVVNIDEPATPTLASFVPLPVNGPHTAEYYKHNNGAEYLVVSTYDLITNPATDSIQSANPLTQRVIVFQIIDTALIPVAQFQLTDNPPAGKLYFPHDTFVQEHPFTNQTLIYVAYWDKGVRVLDFTNPPRMDDPEALTNYLDPAAVATIIGLEEIEGYSEFDPSARNNIHQVRASAELIDGYHVTVAEPEIISAPETGIITFIDSSVPTDLERLGYWTLPSTEAGPLTVNNLDYSPHNFDIKDGVVALAHNKAGLWFIDVSSEENLKDPKTTGYYLPNMDRENSPRDQPYVWGAFWQDDYVFLSDESSGLHILRYTGP